MPTDNLIDDELNDPEAAIKTPEEEHQPEEEQLNLLNAGDRLGVGEAQSAPPPEVEEPEAVDFDNYQPEYKAPGITLTESDAYVGNSEQGKAMKDLEAINALCLYDYDQTFRDEVNNHESYHVYSNKYMRRGRDADVELGKDWLDAMERAGKADKGMSVMPREACRALIAGMEDTNERVRWQKELEEQDMKDNTSSADYYAIAGRIHREDVTRSWLAEQAQVTQKQQELAQQQNYNNDIELYLTRADTHKELAPEVRQLLRDTGKEQLVDTVHKAMGHFQWVVGGQEKAHWLQSFFDAYEDVKDNPDARKLFMQSVAQNAYESEKRGDTNFLRGAGEGISEMQQAFHWLVGSQLGQGGDALDAAAGVLGEGARRQLYAARFYINKLLTGFASDEEVGKLTQAQADWRREISAFMGEFNAAVEQGRKQADEEEGSMGFWRSSGTLVGEILPAMLGGPTPAAAGKAFLQKLGAREVQEIGMGFVGKLAEEYGKEAAMRAAAGRNIAFSSIVNSVFASNAEQSARAQLFADGVLNEDTDRAAESAGLSTYAAFTVAMPLLGGAMRIAMPGIKSAGEAFGGAVARAGMEVGTRGAERVGYSLVQGGEAIAAGAERVADNAFTRALNRAGSYVAIKTAQGGLTGTLVNIGTNTLRTAANFGLLIPTVTAATAGVTEERLNVDPEYRTAYSNYVESMKQLADVTHDKTLLGQSLMLAIMHAPMVKNATKTQILDHVNEYKNDFLLMGLKEEDFEEAKRKHGVNAKAIADECHEKVIEYYRTDPVGTFNRAADYAKLVANQKQAREALQNNATRLLIARSEGIDAEELENGMVRIYRGVRVDEHGNIERGEKYQDVEKDIAEKFLGRLGEGKFKEIADNLRDYFAGRITIDAIKELYGKKGIVVREEIINRQSLRDIQAAAKEAESEWLRLARRGDETITSREQIDPDIWERAGKVIIPRLSSELNLEALVNLPKAFEGRLTTESNRGGTEQRTSAYVVPVRMGDGSTRYVLRHSADADFFALAEELGEQSMLNYLKADGTPYSMGTLAKQLLDMRQWMREDDKYKDVADKFLGISPQLEEKLRDEKQEITPQDYDALRSSVVEAFSTLFRSGMYSDAMSENGNLPNWMRPVMEACAAASVHAPEYATYGDALRTMERVAVEHPELTNKYQNAVLDLWKNHREMMRTLFEEYREDPTPQQLAERELEMKRLQDDLDEQFGKGVVILPEYTDERIKLAHEDAKAEAEANAKIEAAAQNEEDKKLEELKNNPGNENLSKEELVKLRAEKAADAKQEDIDGRMGADPTVKEDNEGVFDGAYTVISSDGFDDVKCGLVPVDKIGFAPEVPQFKIGADEEGVVNTLTGTYRPDHDPIRIWQRADGQLHVISGRHRLAYARQAGATRIMAYVYKESETRNAAWARTLDMEQNIRDNQASELEIALYVRGENAHERQLTPEEIAEAGLDRKGSKGERGVLLGRYAADQILDALRNEMYFSVDDAIRIVEFAKGDHDVQVEGLRVMLGERDEQGIHSNPGSITQARLTMQRFLEVKRQNQGMGIQGEQGLFGFGESLRDTQFNRFYGEYQYKRQKEIRDDRAYLNKMLTGKLSKETEEAVRNKVGKRFKSEGDDKLSLQEIKKRLDELAQKWKNPSAYPELMDEMTAAFKEKYKDEEWLNLDFTAPAQQSVEVQPTTNFSLCGEGAQTAGEMMAAGLMYNDPADGKWKFMLPTRNIHLATGFTRAELNVSNGGKIDTSLGSLMRYTELYRAYPKLEQMRVQIYRDGNANVGGYYAPEGVKENEGSFIAINIGAGTDSERILNTLLHESQHAIQFAEGWARGSRFAGKEDTLRELDKAIAQREKDGLESDWAKDNLAFMKELRQKLSDTDDKDDVDKLCFAAYRMSHGEQEARYEGERSEDREGIVPRITGVSSETIAIRPDKVTSLGGITFGNAGVYSQLMQSRLAPVSSFYMDKRMFDIRKSAVRLTEMLRGFDIEDDSKGKDLLLQASGLAERAVSLLPNDYRFALEPYRIWLTVFSKLSEATPYAASRIVPMEAWQDMMFKAFVSQTKRVFEGRVPAEEMEFWIEGENRGNILAAARKMYNAAEDAARAELAAAAKEGERVKVSAVRKRAFEIMYDMPGFPELKNQVMTELGKVKTEKVMAKLLERVKNQLDAYRKDRTLKAIRKEVEAAYPQPSKDGKPVHGKMSAEAYKKLESYMKLLNMTRGERDKFENENYTGDDGNTAWQDLAPDADIFVPIYDKEGNRENVVYKKQEYDTYACFDGMTAEQAESAARAIGEFITTGRNAWDNKKAQQDQQIASFCFKLMSQFDPSDNASYEAAKKSMGVLPSTYYVGNLLGFLFNPAQTFDVIAHVPGLEEFGRYVGKRIEQAEVDIQSWGKARSEYLNEEIFAKILGLKTEKQTRAFVDAMNKTGDSGVRLIPQEPDVLAKETDALRTQLLTLLARKARKKNFDKERDEFAAAIEYMTQEELMPESIAREIVDKYAALGDASLSSKSGKEAMDAIFTDEEVAKFADLYATARRRAGEAREKWLQEQAERKQEIQDKGGVVYDRSNPDNLQISRGVAAYRIMLYEQADYTDMMRRQGYTDEVIEGLRNYAGKDVMKLAYALREDLNRRTQAIKELYEQLYGMPFPLVENYFRAFFDVGTKAEERDITSRNEGRAGGGKIAIMKTRHKHNEKVDPTMSVLLAYLAATKEQDALLAYRDTPTIIQRVLRYRTDNARMQDALQRLIGRGLVGQMQTVAENMQKSSSDVQRIGNDMSRLLSSVGGAFAQGILNGRIGSLVKQFTAFFNTLCGSDRVSLWEWQKSQSRVFAGLGKISVKEMGQRPELASRFRGWRETGFNQALHSQVDEVSSHGATGNKRQWGLMGMDRLDVWNNERSCAILYDAVYRKAERETPGLSHAELDAIAMEEVRHSLAVKSQPQDWRTRSLLATTRSLLSVGNLFLGGESINTFANVAQLAATGRWSRAAAVWLANGLALQSLTLMYNFITDDEEQWKKRDMTQYLSGVILGPVMGVPIVSQFFSNFMPWMWAPQQSLLPGADLKREIQKITSAFFGKKKTSFLDKSIAVNDCIRFLGTLGLINAPTSAAQAKTKGAAYVVTFASNLVDFLLRTARAAQERL